MRPEIKKGGVGAGANRDKLEPAFRLPWTHHSAVSVEAPLSRWRITFRGCCGNEPDLGIRLGAMVTAVQSFHAIKTRPKTTRPNGVSLAERHNREWRRRMRKPPRRLAPARPERRLICASSLGKRRASHRAHLLLAGAQPDWNNCKGSALVDLKRYLHVGVAVQIDAAPGAISVIPTGANPWPP